MAHDDSPDTDIITERQLAEVGWTAADIRQLPTPHGDVAASYWPVADLTGWLYSEGRP